MQYRIAKWAIQGEGNVVTNQTLQNLAINTIRISTSDPKCLTDPSAPENLPPRFRPEVDYYLLNDGSDEEAEPEDRLFKVPRLDSESTIDGSVDNVAGTDVLPEESVSQVLEDTSVAESTSSTSKDPELDLLLSGSGHTSPLQYYPITKSSIRGPRNWKLIKKIAVSSLAATGRLQFS
ncbi:hypothetical protein V1523DRAFT_429439 [Lipomyces doorenjongii]